MYTCNITGKKFDIKKNDRNREGGLAFGNNCRFRGISYLLTKMLYDEVKILTKVPINKKIKGIGMSDSSWADICAEKFNYINTYYHMEPKLDIHNKDDVQKYNDLNFIISSDVFEHINPYPNLQNAFNNMYDMLKPNGFIVFSVPFIYGDHKEHYPNLYDYKIIKNNDGEYILVNTTIDGNAEIFDNLVFHGGPGNTLEMRMFTKSSLIKYLCDAGFIDIEFHEPDEDMNKYGIFWENICSLIITARK
jgi:SAM-dependent methyltransferase